MATYDPAAVRAQIKTLLLTVSELGTNVYDYNNPSPDGYPCAIIDMGNEQAEFLDEATNLRTIQYTIMLMQEIPVAGEQQAKDSLDAMVKAVVNILEKKANTSLGGTVDWCVPINGQRRHLPAGDGAMYTQEVILNTKVASTIL